MTYNVATATAREIIESRLGRPLGALADMPRDMRDALRLLGRELVWQRHGKPQAHKRRKVTRRSHGWSLSAA